MLGKKYGCDNFFFPKYVAFLINFIFLEEMCINKITTIFNLNIKTSN